MQFHPNELFLYLDPTTSTGKQTRAMATGISSNIKELDWNKVKLTSTLWKEIINMLDLRPKDLLDRSHSEYQEKVRGNTFTMSGWLEILAKNPQYLRAPIAIYRDKAILCLQPTDILKFESAPKQGKALPHLRTSAY